MQPSKHREILAIFEKAVELSLGFSLSSCVTLPASSVAAVEGGNHGLFNLPNTQLSTRPFKLGFSSMGPGWERRPWAANLLRAGALCHWHTAAFAGDPPRLCSQKKGWNGSSSPWGNRSSVPRLAVQLAIWIAVLNFLRCFRRGRSLVSPFAASPDGNPKSGSVAPLAAIPPCPLRRFQASLALLGPWSREQILPNVCWSHAVCVCYFSWMSTPISICI